MDRATFDALVRKHHAGVFRVCRAVLGEDALAADAAQELWMTVLRAPPREPSRAWLQRTAVHRALDLQRRRRVVEPMGDELASGRSAFESASTAELRRRLEEEIRRLPPQQALVFRLRHFGGLRLREVADLLGQSLPTAKTHLARAALRLRSRMVAWQPSAQGSPSRGGGRGDEGVHDES